MGSQRDCTWILGLAGFRAVTTESDGEAVDSRLTIRIERRGVRRYGCSGCLTSVYEASSGPRCGARARGAYPPRYPRTSCGSQRGYRARPDLCS